MRRLIFLASVIFLFGVFSCDKKEIIHPDPLPEWLNQKIAQLNQDLCEFNKIMTIDFKGSKFYVIQLSHSSCMYCDIFDENGTKPTWDENSLQDFRVNLKIITTQSACK